MRKKCSLCNINFDVNKLLIISFLELISLLKNLISSLRKEHKQFSPLWSAVNYYHRELHLGCCISPRSASGHAPYLLGHSSRVVTGGRFSIYNWFKTTSINFSIIKSVINSNTFASWRWVSPLRGSCCFSSILHIRHILYQ